ncbi:MAG: alpha/beta hydrolase [Kordiimonas sp.]|nr:alpha/beta hydrolase [Kordiimonas sp.]
MISGDDVAAGTVILAHGAGAPMDSPFMNYFADGLASAGYRVVRFEFPYMAGRRKGGSKRPPDRQPKLLACWQEVIDLFGPAEKLVIGGKSMGGRMASLIADGAAVAGLVCLGYPFYAPGRPEKPRIEQLQVMRTPTLMVQGTRDAMGSQEAVAAYNLPAQIGFHWADDGNHDLSPRKKSGFTEEGNWQSGVAAAADFIAGL